MTRTVFHSDGSAVGAVEHTDDGYVGLIDGELVTIAQETALQAASLVLSIRNARLHAPENRSSSERFFERPRPTAAPAMSRPTPVEADDDIDLGNFLGRWAHKGRPRARG